MQLMSNTGVYERCAKCGYITNWPMHESTITHNPDRCTPVDLGYVRRHRGIIAHDLEQLRKDIAHWNNPDLETSQAFCALAERLYLSTGKLPHHAPVPLDWYLKEDTW